MRRIVAGAVMLLMAVEPVTASAQQASTQAAEKPDYSKHFYFHKPGVTVDVAKADFAECTTYGANVVNIEQGTQTMFVPYTGTLSPLAAGLAGGVGGLIGGLLLDAFVKGPQRKAMRRTVLRKCMGFKGYSRFGMEKDIWEKLNDGDDKDAVGARFAALAAGPEPTATALPL